jgi:peroxiredoxin Q/BCP
VELFRDRYAEFERRKVAVVGVSRDSVESHQRFHDELKLPFALLSDPDAKVHEAYGVMKNKVVYGQKKRGPERTTFVIDERGRIERVYPAVRVDGHPEAVLRDLG